MEEVVKTIELNNKTFLVISDMVFNDTKYYYLVSEDGNELHIVKEFKDGLNSVIKSVTDEDELKTIFNMFNENIANEKD